jgi:preprotein translocase subunit SecB
VPEKKNRPSRREEQYSEFLHSIKLIALGLENCSANLNRRLYATLAAKKNTDRSILSDYRLGEVEKEFFDVSANFTMRVEDKAKTSRALSIECSFAAHFHCETSEWTNEFAERFTQSELRLILWPYFREFVNDISSKMAIPPLLIPLSVPARHSRDVGMER